MLRFPVWQALGHFCGSYISYAFVLLTALAVENALLGDGGSAISSSSVNVRTSDCRGTPTLCQCSLLAAINSRSSAKVQYGDIVVLPG
jgi:hypothetical protein